MGSEMGWPTRACMPAELTLIVGPSLLASRRSTAGDPAHIPGADRENGNVPSEIEINVSLLVMGIKSHAG